jgi:hypothetical protein
MSKSTCPYCGQQAVTAQQKASMGPTKIVPCRSCGKRVSVGWVSVLALVPFLAGIAAMAFLRSITGGVILIGGIVAMFAIHEYLVPLVGREN